MDYTPVSLADCFATLSKTNDPASAKERERLISALREPQMALQQLRDEVSALNARMDRLSQQERRLTEDLQPYQAILSPFRYLPDDILREIFLACLPRGRNPSINTQQAPILLTHISRHTRHIALSTARLWASIHVDIVYPGYRFSRLQEAVDEWLRRAGACDLDISVHEELHASLPHHAVSESGGILGSLFKAPTQIRRISLSCLYASSHLFFLADVHKYPNLESFTYSASRMRRGEDPQKFFNARNIGEAPSLRRLKLFTAGSLGNYRGYKVDWKRITHLDLGSAGSPIKMACVGAILQHTSELCVCRLSVKEGESLPPLSLPHLKSLALKFHDEEWFLNAAETVRIFAEVSFPALKSITYDGAYGVAPLLGLLKGSDGRLEHMCITRITGPIPLIDCLHCCPNLVALELCNPGRSLVVPTDHSLWPWYLYIKNIGSTAIEEYLFPALTPRGLNEGQWAEPPEALCPKMEYLAIRDGDREINVAIVESFVRAKRSPPNGRIEYRSLKGMLLEGAENIVALKERLRRQIDDGLQLALTRTSHAPTETTPRRSGNDIPPSYLPGWWPSIDNL